MLIPRTHLLLAIPLTALPLMLACGDKGDDTGGTHDGGAVDGGSADGGASDGGSADGGSADGGASDGGAGDGGSSTTEWADMTREERQKYMNETVMPAMTKLFQAHDATLYADMNCALCHGENFSDPEIDFAMPNPNNADRFRVGDGAPGVISWTGGGETYVIYRDDFMPNVILPAMAELLGTEPWSESNPDGLTCGACHPAGG
ncbi:MAG: hypothetical protein D6798_20660 [Deltaproteobacteria bacterium]|nr:MAG: hypothetical protein D6798_20660 [Deltaproteobacteria bacterium]